MHSIVVLVVLFAITNCANCQIPMSPNRGNFYKAPEFKNPKTIILFEQQLELEVDNFTRWTSFLPDDGNFIFLFTGPVWDVEFYEVIRNDKIDAIAVGKVILNNESEAMAGKRNLTFQTRGSILDGFTITTMEFDPNSKRDFRDFNNYRNFKFVFRIQVAPEKRRVNLRLNCTYNEDCPTNSACVKTDCTCNKGFSAIGTPRKPNPTCMRISTYGQPCRYYEQCWNPTSELHCTNRTCLCGPEQVWIPYQNSCEYKFQFGDVYPLTQAVLDSTTPKVIVSNVNYPTVNFVQSDLLFKAMGPIIVDTDNEVNFLTATEEYQIASWKNYSRTWEGEPAFPNFTAFEQAALVKPEPRVGFYFDEEFRVNEQILQLKKFSLGDFVFEADICKVNISKVNQAGEFRIFTHWVEGLGTMKSCGVFFNEPISAAQITLWYKNVSFSNVYIAGAVTKSLNIHIPSRFLLEHDSSNAKIEIANLENVPFNLALCHLIDNRKFAAASPNEIVWLPALGLLTVLIGIIAYKSWKLEFSKAELNPIYDEANEKIQVYDEKENQNEQEEQDEQDEQDPIYNIH